MIFVRDCTFIERFVVLYQDLGSSGIKVSQVAFGAWGLGGGNVWSDRTLSAGDVADLLDQAADLGINYIDTAPVYGLGQSELILVEGFFSKMTKQMLRGIRVKTKAELVNRIYLYFEEVNAEPVVFHWKYNLGDIDVSEEVIVDTLPLKKSS